MNKCNFEGVIFKPDGVHTLDPCVYEDVAIYKNVTIIISKCSNCGHVEISWMRQEDTEEMESINEKS